MWSEFKAFLIKQNILALAIAFVIGAATNNLVQALVNDFIMPVVQAITPTEGWEEATARVGPVELLVGHFGSVLLNFLIVGFVAWRISVALIKPPPPDKKPATRPCPFCRQAIDAEATRCAFCTSQLEAVA
ncbi:MAG TPA: MscL family protein [Gemmatimonadaceae bacterium]|nr:MscL family protein [Gemmatimonadaceae bacterium]